MRFRICTAASHRGHDDLDSLWGSCHVVQLLLIQSLVVTVNSNPPNKSWSAAL